ncbi:MAG: sec-independent protein translocase protein TatA [Puniceicoccaceae bacterium 5H]|nr:MAG: sec-independent protein translocase protein TatA [Puniceicoccaceae bacterium 5H]
MFSTDLAFIQNLSATEITLILLIVLLLFGAKRLPELARSMGKSMQEFKKATREVQEDFQNAMDSAGEDNSSAQKKQQAQAPAQTQPRAESQAEGAKEETEHAHTPKQA